MIPGFILANAIALSQPMAAPQAEAAWHKTAAFAGCYLDRSVALPQHRVVAVLASCRRNVLSRWTYSVVLVDETGKAATIPLTVRAEKPWVTAGGALAWTSTSDGVVTFYEMSPATRTPRQTGQMRLEGKGHHASVTSGRRCDVHTVVRQDDPSRNKYVYYITASGASPTAATKIAETYTFTQYRPSADGNFIAQDGRDPPGPIATRPKPETMDCDGRRALAEEGRDARVAKVRVGSGDPLSVERSPKGDLLVQTGYLSNEVAVLRGDDLAVIESEETEISHGPANFEGTVWRSKWSPDGSSFLVIIGFEVRIHQTADLRLLARWPVRSPIDTDVEFLSNDAAYVVTKAGRVDVFGWR